MHPRYSPSGAWQPEPAIVVPDIAGLATTPKTPYPAGALAWIETLKAAFLLDRSATEAPLAGQRIAADDGVGLWRRLVPFDASTNPWSSQAAWYIDPTAGNVEGDGSAAHPISSWTELESRLHGSRIAQATTVNVLGDLSSEILDLSSLDIRQPLTIEGTATTQLATTLTAVTTPSEVTNEWWLVQANGVADWTPYVGMRCRVTAGPNAGALFWIAKVDPDGLGLNVARVTEPVDNLNWYTPAPGDGIVIESLPTMLDFQAGWRGTPIRDTPTYDPQSVILKTLRFYDPSIGDRSNTTLDPSPYYMLGCELATPVLIRGTQQIFTACWFSGGLPVDSFGTMIATTCESALFYGGGALGLVRLLGPAGHLLRFLVQDGHMHTNTGAVFELDACGIFDSDVRGNFSGVESHGAARFTFTSNGGAARGMLGKGHSQYGMRMFEPGMVWAYFHDKPVITGAVNDASFAGDAKTWAAGVPFFDGAANRATGMVGF